VTRRHDIRYFAESRPAQSASCPDLARHDAQAIQTRLVPAAIEATAKRWHLSPPLLHRRRLQRRKGGIACAPRD
jgi:hypothetical protein